MLLCTEIFPQNISKLLNLLISYLRHEVYVVHKHFLISVSTTRQWIRRTDYVCFYTVLGVRKCKTNSKLCNLLLPLSRIESRSSIPQLSHCAGFDTQATPEGPDSSDIFGVHLFGIGTIQIRILHSLVSRGSIPDRAMKGFFSLPPPDRLWHQPHSHVSGNRGVFPGVQHTTHFREFLC
jgi:hypothetical protein